MFVAPSFDISACKSKLIRDNVDDMSCTDSMPWTGFHIDLQDSISAQG